MANSIIKKAAAVIATGTMLFSGMAGTGASGLFSSLTDSSITVSAAVSKPDVIYSTHIQTYGWGSASKNGASSGTTGQKKRLEAVKIQCPGIQYRSHVSGIGWQSWKKSGEISGTTGQSRAIEAIEIKLTGEYAKYYDVYYQLHVQRLGWLGWAKNGESAGSTGNSLRAEAICIKIVKKGESVSNGKRAFFYFTNYGCFDLADEYAAYYAFRKNPEYNYYPENNCCNFVSQCLVAGGWKTNSQWNKNTLSFRYIPSFREYMLSQNVTYTKNPTRVSQIQKGDIVESDNGNHVMFVRYIKGSEIHIAANTYDHDDYAIGIGSVTGVYKTSERLKTINK